MLIASLRLPVRRHRLLQVTIATCAAIVASAGTACSDTSGPAVAVTLRLYTVDGVFIPTPLKDAGGRAISIGNGRLQGTNRGYACGMSLQLTDGPITAVDVPDCRLFTGEEKRVSVSLTDSRFPSGVHEYRFIQ